MIRRHVLWISALLLLVGSCDQRPGFGGTSAYPTFEGPNPPSNLTAKVLSESEISLAWRDNSRDETDFEIQRFANGQDMHVIYVLANATSYVDSGLAEGTEYTYFVFALGASTSSSPSNEAIATTHGKALLTTSPTSNLAATSAQSGGTISSSGGTEVVSRGVCWSTHTSPTLNDFKTVEAGGIGTFISNVDGLTPNTVYFIRSYATNNAGTAYGNQVTFTTLP